MSATLSSPTLLQTSYLHKTTICTVTERKVSFRVRASAGRRQLAVALTGATVAGVLSEFPARAAEIGLFGIRKSLKKAEEKAEELVKEGFEAADKGIVTAEKAVESAEKEVLAAEKEVASAVSFGGLAQATAVFGAELVGILVASAVVNGILGPEARNSST